MCIWTKQNNLLWPLVFLFFLGFSSSIVVCAVQDDAVFVDSDSELPENMKKYMKIDENTITVTLDPDPTKSLLLPLIAKNSPKCLSFNTSQAGGCGNGTKWEVKYPSGLDNCSLVGMWSISERGPELKLSSGKKDVGGLIGSEVVLNIAGDNVILEGVTLPSLSCAVNALRNPDADYAMNLEFTASCSAVLKFDRQKFAIKRLIKKTIGRHCRKLKSP